MRLPIFDNLTVEHLSLYKAKITQAIQPGVNMVIGGNGVGKTTLVKTVLFALVGNAEYERFNSSGKAERVPIVDSDFFKGRINARDESQATVSLKFRIGKTRIQVSRTLFRPKIMTFSIGGRLQTARSGSNLETIYQRKLLPLLGVKEFEHFVFIVANLLLFDEERRTLIWDAETQNRVITLLFLAEFRDKMFTLSEEATVLDTTGRHKSETRKDINKSIARWLDSEKSATKKADVTDTKKVVAEMTEIGAEIEDLDQHIAEKESRIETETNHISQLTSEGDDLEAEKIGVLKELQRLEGEFYSDIYRALPAQYLLVLQTLATQGKCQVCGTDRKSLKDLGRKLKADGKCLVCRSPITYSSKHSAPPTAELSGRINELRERLDALTSKQQACLAAQATANQQLYALQPELSKLFKLKRALETRSSTLEIALQKAAGSAGPADTWLLKQKQDIEKLNREIAEAYRRRSEVLSELRKVNEHYVKRLRDVNDVLTPLFSQFASKFLGVTCNLVVSVKIKARKPITYMYPRFNEKDRSFMFEVSESQRFFIDQAFRMALITLFSTQGQENPTFFIVETPEGSLDLAYERNVAQMYLNFAEYGHTIIITSNLNSSNFLQGLYQKLGTKAVRRERTLDLFQFGRLSAVQDNTATATAFNKRMDELGLRHAFNGSK
jgi:hypothetical protein